jgi:Citrate lyase synthetase
MKSNVLYRENGYLVLSKQEVNFNILVEWFIRHLNDNVYITENNQLVGIISCKEFENSLRSRINQIPINNSFLYVDSVTANDRIEIYKRFEKDLTLFRLPVIESNQIIGEYYDSLSYKENTERYHIKNIIPELSAFTEELSIYFKKNKIHTLAIVSDTSDEYTKKVFSSINDYSPIFFDNYDTLIHHMNNGESFDAILDIKYPDEYREYYINKYSINKNVLIIFEIMSEILTILFVKYCETNKLKLIAVYAVGAEDINYWGENDCQTMSINKTMIDVLNDQEYLKKFYGNNEECYRYATDSGFGRLGGRIVRFNGLYNRLIDVESKYINVTNGIRNTDASPEKYENEIHFFGPCIVEGICVTDNYTIESYLQRKLNFVFPNRFKVLNHGSATHTPYGSFCNDFFHAMDTTFHEGDYIIILDAFTPNALKVLSENNVSIIDERRIFDGSENLFLNNTYHCNHIANEIYAEMIYTKLLDVLLTRHKDNLNTEGKIINSYFVATKKNLSFRDDAFLNDSELQSYCEKLRKLRITGAESMKIGSICTQANPFTKGHKALVEYASHIMDHVYLFVAQDSLSDIQFIERFNIAVDAVKELENVTVLSTGFSLSSYKIFPDYFSVAKKKTGFDLTNVWAETRIFAELFCPALGITYRILGEEPLDLYTKKLVEHLSDVLPQYGIQTVIMPRVMTDNNEVISASRVRKLIADKQYESLERYITPYAIDTLKRYYNEVLEYN